MDHLASLLAVAVVSLLAAVSPGPDFFIVLRNSLTYSRERGYMTAFGVACALIVHLTYTFVGIGILIAESPFVYHLIKFVGVAYLLYLGTKGLVSSFKAKDSKVEQYTQERMLITPRTAFMQGFLTNLLNPKCALFFVSLFSQFIDTDTPALLRFEYALLNWVIVLTWFLFLSYLVTGRHVQGRLRAFQTYIDRIMGVALILIALKLLVS